MSARTVGLGFALNAAAPLPARDWSAELMSGSAYNFPTPLTVHQDGYPDIRTTADYHTRPFGPEAPYYAWRISAWDADSAWEISQIHHRLFLSNPPPEIQYFSVHFGYSYFLLGRAWRRAGFIFHLGIGPIVTNPDSSVRGMVRREVGSGLFDAGYYFSGIGTEAAVEKMFLFWRGAFVNLEAALTAADAWSVPVADGHAEVPNLALHGHLGVGYRF